MKLGLVTDSLGELSFPLMVEKAASLGIESLEIPTGGWSQAPHIDIDSLLESKKERDTYLQVIHSNGLELGTLNCSGNQLAPNPKGKEHNENIEKTFQLANLLGIEKIVMMSGLPGGSPQDTTATWITTSWPPENIQIERWQWEERILPYWEKLSKKAEQLGITQIALENHGCQAVYNAETLQRLRKAIGPIVGMNLDPSHLFWMGGDPIQMAYNLKGMIYHVHAKDVRIETGTATGNGLLDTKPIDKWAQRSWNYVAVGYGHDQLWWNTFFTALKKVGYDGMVSLEMEDMSMPPLTGIEKSLATIKAAMP
ncbi:MAG: sugar phosphate isomerase/epimerase [Spirochaetia bacterium]|jgi:sugar phosphate isomerase/epimerase|nr:sugar phosphate isomerase/epimerase [Spirochaetia bacterium]